MRLEDGTVMRLYRQTVEDFSIYAGRELTQEELEHLNRSAAHLSAKMRAVRIVSAASVSKRDLEHRLIQKGEDPDEARSAVAWMEDMRLLDDRKLAAQVVEHCAAKGYGISRAKQALYEKRVPKQYWDEALEDYPDQTDAIVSFLQSRLGEHWDQKDLRRAMDALLRRGHTYSQIRQGVRQLAPDGDFPEDM